MNEDEGEYASLGEEGADDLPKKRGRGRPPTTGEFVGLREKREEEATLRKEKEREQGTKMTPPPPLSKDLRAYEARCTEEMGLTRTPDIAARSLEQAAAIDRIAACSGNLKGSL